MVAECLLLAYPEVPGKMPEQICRASFSEPTRAFSRFLYQESVTGERRLKTDIPGSISEGFSYSEIIAFGPAVLRTR